jgi:hypothetical protein
VLLRTYAHHRSDGQDSAAALEALLDRGRPPMRVLSGEHAQDCDQNGDHEAGHAASAGR